MSGNIHRMKIGGFIEVDAPLELDKEYSVALERVQVDETKNMMRKKVDDYFNYTYPIINLGAVTLITEGDVIKGEPKNSRASKRLRGRSWVYANEQGLDEEEHYQETISNIIEYYEDIIDFIKHKKGL